MDKPATMVKLRPQLGYHHNYGHTSTLTGLAVAGSFKTGVSFTKPGYWPHNPGHLETWRHQNIKIGCTMLWKFAEMRLPLNQQFQYDVPLQTDHSGAPTCVDPTI